MHIKFLIKISSFETKLLELCLQESGSMSSFMMIFLCNLKNRPDIILTRVTFDPTLQVVCYIYFTRIIKYFLEITLPFHYGWLEAVLTEMFLLVFYILIGYKFRPMCDNPYLQVPTEDEEEMQMDEV